MLPLRPKSRQSLMWIYFKPSNGRPKTPGLNADCGRIIFPLRMSAAALSAVLFAMLLAASGPCAASAEEPKPMPGPPPQYYLCPGPHGAPAAILEAEYRRLIKQQPQLESFCRKELRWEAGSQWLCRVNDHVLLSDYPVDRTGLLLSEPLVERLIAVKKLECRPLNAPCKAGRFLLRKKQCGEPIAAGEKDYWLRFSHQANRPPSPLAARCPGGEELIIYYPAPLATTGCVSERCVLEHSSGVWREVLDRFDPLEAEPIDLEYFPPRYLTVRSREREAEISEPGIYCVSYTLRRSEHTPEARSEYLVESAELLQSYPQKWPLSAAHQQNDERPTVLDSLRCKTDADCVQGQGRGMCMIKAMAPESGEPAADPSYRCVCAKGPVMHGCVAQSVE